MPVVSPACVDSCWCWSDVECIRRAGESWPYAIMGRVRLFPIDASLCQPYLGYPRCRTGDFVSRVALDESRLSRNLSGVRLCPLRGAARLKGKVVQRIELLL